MTAKLAYHEETGTYTLHCVECEEEFSHAEDSEDGFSFEWSKAQAEAIMNIILIIQDKHNQKYHGAH